MFVKRLFPSMFSCLVIGLSVAAAETTISVPQPTAVPARARPVAPAMNSARSHSLLLKNYEAVTKNAQTLPGVFPVHRVGDRLYFEIPAGMFRRLMLWRAEVAKAASGHGYGGMSLGHQVLRWERRGDKVYLWKAAFGKRADSKTGQLAVEFSNQDTIVAAFAVEAESNDGAAVIQATPLFTGGFADLSVVGHLGGGSVDASRSLVADVKAFPTNVEVRSLLTVRSIASTTAVSVPAEESAAQPKPTAKTPVTSSGTTHTTLVHYSLALLPEKPMMGRFADPRVGYFSEGFEQYDDPWTVRRAFIARFRLEKKDSSAAVSEPMRPIVFFLGREVPDKWRPYLKKGVEDWRPAFEAAGFKDAIFCKDAPDPVLDPSWDPEDARWSVMRWAALPIKNAIGPHVHDPRSGEILSGHIIFWHDIVKSVQLRYFVECGAVDARARRLPFPDDLTGELLRNVAAHEVGHTLGLRHNHRASQAFSIAQLRDPVFTAKYGSVASIMSYGRNNYVAQPEDGVKSLTRKVGPYDHFAISWGYKPIPQARSPRDERPALDEWAARQLQEPWLRFGGEDGAAVADPTVLTENIGSDPVQATALGLQNVDRLLEHLITATTSKGGDFSLLEEVYRNLLHRERYWYGAVAKQVGGVCENRTLAGRGGQTFVRVPKAKQQEATRFLLDHAFVAQRKLLNPAIVNQFLQSGVADDVLVMQSELLKGLVSPETLNRLFDAEVLDRDSAYSALEFVRDVQQGLWSELDLPQPRIEALRRALQRVYLATLSKQLEPPPPAAAMTTAQLTHKVDPLADTQATVRAALHNLARKIQETLPKVNDPPTRAHLEDALSCITSATASRK